MELCHLESHVLELPADVQGDYVKSLKHSSTLFNCIYMCVNSNWDGLVLARGSVKLLWERERNLEILWKSVFKNITSVIQGNKPTQTSFHQFSLVDAILNSNQPGQNKTTYIGFSLIINNWKCKVTSQKSPKAIRNKSPALSPWRCIKQGEEAVGFYYFSLLGNHFWALKWWENGRCKTETYSDAFHLNDKMGKSQTDSLSCLLSHNSSIKKINTPFKFWVDGDTRSYGCGKWNWSSEIDSSCWRAPHLLLDCVYSVKFSSECSLGNPSSHFRYHTKETGNLWFSHCFLLSIIIVFC